jgi:hypothetical protein
VAQLHERALLKHGTGNDLAPNAQLQHVFVNLQDDLFDSGHHMLILGRLRPISLASEFRGGVLEQVAFDAAPIRPLSERVTWREITQDVPFGQDERHHADDGPATGRRPCLSFRRRKVRAPNDFYFFAFFFFDFLKPTLPALGS